MEEFVENKVSLNGFLWRVLTADERSVQTMMQKMNLPEIVARLLVLRGLSADTADSFLYTAGNPVFVHELVCTMN